MSEKGVQVIDRAFDIIEQLSEEKDGLGITDISVRLSLNKSTVHRIVSALVHRGYVEKTQGGMYKIGLKFVEMASISLNKIELKTEARAFLYDLSQKLRNPTHLGILDNLDVVYIDKVDMVDSIRLYSQIGKRIAVHCSALGKTLLSDTTEKELQTMFEGYEFTVCTPNTITSKAVLIQEILMAKTHGYAVDDEEHDLNIRCIAAPVYDYRNKMIAAISAAGSCEAFPKSRDAEIGAIVADTANSLSKRLGHRPSAGQL